MNLALMGLLGVMQTVSPPDRPIDNISALRDSVISLVLERGRLGIAELLYPSVPRHRHLISACSYYSNGDEERTPVYASFCKNLTSNDSAFVLSSYGRTNLGIPMESVMIDWGINNIIDICYDRSIRRGTRELFYGHQNCQSRYRDLLRTFLTPRRQRRNFSFPIS